MGSEHQKTRESELTLDLDDVFELEGSEPTVDDWFALPKGTIFIENMHISTNQWLKQVYK